MNIFRRLVVIVVLLFPCVSYSSDIVRHYLKEVPLAKALKDNIQSAGDGFEYAASADILVINLVDTREKLNSIQLNDPAVSANTLKFNILNRPFSWKFYKKGGGYSSNSGAMALHYLQVSLPDCSYGNVWKPGTDFSISINGIEPSMRHKVVFTINGKDISTLFHYSEAKQAFAVKEFYQDQFLEHFKGRDGVIGWSLKESNISGKVSIALGNKRIEGVICNLDGRPSAFFAGKEVRLSFAGSDKLIPHEVFTKVGSNGKYAVDGLASFEYTVSVDGIPSMPVQLKSLTKSKNGASLSVNHLLPTYDMILSTSEERPYSPGELLIMLPVSLDSRLTGDISNFMQLAGDKVTFSAVNNRITMVMPVKREYPEDLIFHMQVGNTKILLKIKHPVPLNKGYEQFRLFDTEGVYAKTEVTNLEGGGVLMYSSSAMPNSSINTISRIMKDNVRLHYYHGITHRATEVTDLFIWSDSRQSVYGDESRHDKLYGILSDEAGTLAVTFCLDNQEKICFRSKQTVRPGGTTVNVKLSGQNIKAMRGKQLILKELHVTDNPVARSVSVDNSGKAVFTGIPHGMYLIYLADTSLEGYAKAVVNISAEDNNKRVVKNETLQLGKVPAKIGNVQLEKLMNGNTVSLSYEPVLIRHNDYRLIDLKELNSDIKEPVSDIRVLGTLPGEYIVYRDNNIALFTDDIQMNSYVTMVFESGGVHYRLPLYFQSSNYAIVREEGLDYAMCPEERTLCTNAFVHVQGVSQGIYNGNSPLSMTFPISFKEGDVAVYMDDDVNVTDIFRIIPSRKQLILKKERIPGFLSTLSSGEEQLTVKIKDRVYYVTLIPGYKNIAASVLDESGAQSQLFAGLSAMLSCQYAPERYYSQIGTVKASGVLSFDNLPNCNYELTVLDKDRLFDGYLSNLDLAAGQNSLNTVFLVRCVGSNSILIDKCQPLLPILPDRQMIAPDFGMILNERLLSGGVNKVSTEPKNGLKYAVFSEGMAFFAPADTPQQVAVMLENADRKSEFTINIDPLATHMQQVLNRPPDSTAQPLSVEGVTSSYVYQGNYQLKFKMDPFLSYEANEVSIFADDEDITELFAWNAKAAELVLKNEEIGSFLSILGGGQKALVLSFAEGEDERHYKFSVVIGAGVTDISGQIVVDGAQKLSSGAKAIMIGTKMKNGHEFRQLTNIKNGDSFVFSNIPLGIYDLVVFDMASGLYGRREISVDMRNSDIFIEIPVRKIQ